MAPEGDPLWHQVFRKNSSVVKREIAGEVLLVPIRGQLAQLHRLFVLNEVGDFIWQQIDGVRDLAAIHRGMVERFEVSDEEARADLIEYVGSLRDAQLIEAV